MKHQTFRILIVIGLLLSMTVPLLSCSTNEALGAISQNARTLDTPTGLRIEGGSLCWNPVEYASRYTVNIDGREFYCDDYRYPLNDLGDGTHIFKVKANGDGVVYVSSSFSEAYSVSLENGAVSTSDYYGQFDELTKNESFLGYGFDVIKSSVFSDKYVKNSFRIFNTDELMKLRLVKVDSKQSFIDEVQSSSMEDFMASWNANANVDVGWGKKRVGGSVSVEAAYSGGVEDARSKYFHCITIYNQKFYIVMQADMDTYRSILSEGFMNDLYSDMTPAELFNRYGTHFITSAVMGGKINSYYLYSSSEEKSYHDVSSKVSTEVRYLVGNTNVDVEGGYKQFAESQNINIKNTLEVIGGGNFGMLSDADIGSNYKNWEASLDDHASLIGIKDTNSLIPIWDLIDASKDTKIYSYSYDGQPPVEGSRAQQLQAYFMAYGTESFGSLLEAAGLPTIHVPEEIIDVRVNNQDSVTDEYEVFAGTLNDLAFTVLPTDAIGYTKTASISTVCDWAHIVNEKGTLALSVDSNAPVGEVIEIVLSAGSARKVIKVVIRKQYTVSFVTNGGTNVDAIKNVMHGSQIDAPAAPTKSGYVFAGWYTDRNFAEDSLYRFGYQAVESNLTLYAKWDVLTYKINYYIERGNLYKTETVVWNVSPSAPSDPEKEGCLFIGWYSDPECTVAFDFSALLTKDCNVYAKWELRQCTVSFETNGGTAVESITVSYGQKISLPVTKKQGESFGGWYRDAGFAVLFDFSKDVISEDITLYALWTVNPVVTVIFDCAGGDPVDSRILESGATLGADMPTAVRTGYTFDGWYSEKDGGTRVYSTDIITESRTLYAHWTAKTYTITFDGCGGTTPKSQTVVYGEAYGPLPETTLAGHNFDGWFCDGVRYSEGVWNTDADITLTAHWSAKTFTVTLQTCGGSLNENDIIRGYTYGIGASLPYTVKRNGYIFAGWYDAENGKGNFYTAISTTDEGEKVFYAYWVQTKSYTTVLPETTISYTDHTSVEVCKGSTSIVIAVPNELKNMQSTGHLRVKVTVSGQAKLQYRSTDTTATATIKACFGNDSYTDLGTLNAKGGGWPWTWVNPAYGDEATKTVSLSKSFTVNSVSMRLQFGFQYRISFDEYKNWAGGTHAVNFSCNLGSVSYQFYIE